MPLYFFHLRGGNYFDDPDGTVLRDDAAARKHARDVAHEVMRNDEIRHRDWTLEVRNEADARVFTALFADLDPTLDHLDPGFRASVARVSKSLGDLKDAMRECQMIILRGRAARARAAGKPYVIAVHGRNVG